MPIDTQSGMLPPTAEGDHLGAVARGVAAPCIIHSFTMPLPLPPGKSTLIKVLTGDLRQSAGEVTRHPNLRVAYVAQHAFQHLEDHLETTPCK